MTVYDEYYLMSQIKKLEAELAEAKAWADSTSVSRMKTAARIRDLENELAEARAWADTMLRKIETLEAQIAARETK